MYGPVCKPYPGCPRQIGISFLGRRAIIRVAGPNPAFPGACNVALRPLSCRLQRKDYMMRHVVQAEANSTPRSIRETGGRRRSAGGWPTRTVNYGAPAQGPTLCRGCCRSRNRRTSTTEKCCTSALRGLSRTLGHRPEMEVHIKLRCSISHSHMGLAISAG
ncbi:hypothetical protein N658DRAFT_557651 [Parathielavia hyrcaniae]|uniref:Uncharacterized protein n=1 Tax=Parathielavia hyrcaniae TaxID=113614 RepID=A0AAN6Q3Y1_9PEZI|nr:hypothetical protein N658DRAFT_557651 [Parathielavia hyrcaniae]